MKIPIKANKAIVNEVLRIAGEVEAIPDPARGAPGEGTTRGVREGDAVKITIQEGNTSREKRAQSVVQSPARRADQIRRKTEDRKRQVRSLELNPDATRGLTAEAEVLLQRGMIRFGFKYHF